MIMNWQFWIAVVPIIFAGVALIINYTQMRLNNKLHLFDKRLEMYIIVKGLIELYKAHHLLLNTRKDAPFYEVDICYLYMTNNVYLEGIGPAIKHPLEDPFQRQLLIKMEDLKNIATKINYLFTGKGAKLLGDFVLYYQELLFKMYQYQILINKMKKDPDFTRLPGDEIRKAYGEKNSGMICKKLLIICN